MTGSNTFIASGTEYSELAPLLHQTVCQIMNFMYCGAYGWLGK
jgi:hypothetical protein